jgi:hypothetical protein
VFRLLDIAKRRFWVISPLRLQPADGVHALTGIGDALYVVQLAWDGMGATSFPHAAGAALLVSGNLVVLRL